MDVRNPKDFSFSVLFGRHRCVNSECFDWYSLGRRAAGLGWRVRRSSGRALGRIGVAAVILLWGTGLWLGFQVYGGAFSALGSWFALKMIAVVLLTVCVGAAQFLAAAARRRNEPAPASLMSSLGSVIAVSAVLAVVFGVLTFSG